MYVDEALLLYGNDALHVVDQDLYNSSLDVRNLANFMRQALLASSLDLHLAADPWPVETLRLPRGHYSGF
jgi:hypothetical protein